MEGDLLIRLYAYLQKFTVFMLNGECVASITMIIYGILVRGKQVNKFPGGSMQSKHAQEYDSEDLM